jgi:hypothetical protein
MEESTMITSLNREGAREQAMLPLRQGPYLKPLWLTRQEALRLVELSVTSTADLTQVEKGTLRKLGDLCRAFLLEDGAS